VFTATAIITATETPRTSASTVAGPQQPPDFGGRRSAMWRCSGTISAWPERRDAGRSRLRW
jgi:hypothetical protein